ncbi:MAG: hypothetical protein H0V14_08985, partial [Chitinophagaceae bacterium]|nr:hypothetical protein [Chitinophagaceae bacterium]
IGTYMMWAITQEKGIPDPRTPYGAENKKDIVIDVNAATGVATVETQVYGDYPGAPDIQVSTGGGANFAFSCIGVITLNLNHFSPDFGDQGDYTLTLKKK